MTGIEYGITSTVRTFSSTYQVLDIIRSVCSKKTDAVFSWLMKQGLHPEKMRTLVIGSYLTGAAIADRMGKISQVTVLDIYPHLGALLDPGISFTSDPKEVTGKKWDLIIDTSGLGGINPTVLSVIGKPMIFIVEDPCSAGTDERIRSLNQSMERIALVDAPIRGRLRTEGLSTKTSGTMSLAVEILIRSVRDAQSEDGTLYSTTSLEFYERILFQEKNPEEFLSRLNRPALFVSSLSDIDCDMILNKNLGLIHSEVIDEGIYSL